MPIFFFIKYSKFCEILMVPTGGCIVGFPANVKIYFHFELMQKFTFRCHLVGWGLNNIFGPSGQRSALMGPPGGHFTNGPQTYSFPFIDDFLLNLRRLMFSSNLFGSLLRSFLHIEFLHKLLIEFIVEKKF